jgi:hypothetical protein
MRSKWIHNPKFYVVHDGDGEFSCCLLYRVPDAKGLGWGCFFTIYYRLSTLVGVGCGKLGNGETILGK